MRLKSFLYAIFANFMQKVSSYLFILLTFYGCKDKIEENSLANFELKSVVVHEGTSLEVVQKSLNTSKYEWSIEGLNLYSNESAPLFFMDSAGLYTLQLIAKGGNGSSSIQKINFEVLPDTMWRLSNNSSKEWQISSILSDGVEQIVDDCQLDDVLLLKQSATSNDSFFFREEFDTCNSGIQFFDLPAKGIWSLNKANNSLAIEISSRGKATSFEFKIEDIRKNYFKGTDFAVNTTLVMRNN